MQLNILIFTPIAVLTHSAASRHHLWNQEKMRAGIESAFNNAVCMRRGKAGRHGKIWNSEMLKEGSGNRELGELCEWVNAGCRERRHRANGRGRRAGTVLDLIRITQSSIHNPKSAISGLA